jgi:hypothetical protein
MGVVELRRGLALAGFAVVALLGLAAIAVAGHTVTADSHSTVVNGWDPKNKPSCSSYGNFSASVTVGSIANGQYGGIIEIYGFDGEKFNWRFVSGAEHLYDMGIVLVKGGPRDLEKYVYDYTGAGLDDHDEGLTGPPNSKGGVYGSSNALFCLDPKGGGDN